MLRTKSVCYITKAEMYRRTLSERAFGLGKLRNRDMRERRSTSERCISLDAGFRKASRRLYSGFERPRRNEMLWLLRNSGACMNKGEEFPRTLSRLICGTTSQQHKEKSEQQKIVMS